jgi:cytochrome P450
MPVSIVSQVSSDHSAHQSFWLTGYGVFAQPGLQPLIAIEDPAEHSVRRKVWERAFTPNAIKSYEPFLRNRIDQLMAQLSARAGQPTDVAQWFAFMTTDFMGDFAYGGAFNLLQEGRDEYDYHGAMTGFNFILELFGAVPWVRPLALRLPKNNGAQRMLDMGDQVVQKRIGDGSQIRDLFHYLVSHPRSSFGTMADNMGQLNEDGESGSVHPPLGRVTLASEATLAIIAGSDTTSTALSNAVFYLIQHPAVLSRLRRELDVAAGEGSPYDAQLDTDLASLKYLQAVINETMRLQPAVPNGVQRVPPSDAGSVVIAGQ